MGVTGINDSASTAGRNIYHNSVYVGGALTSGANSSWAFRSSGTSNTRNFRNNIFVNARSNNGGTGSHYAMQYGGTTPNPAGLTASNNIFLVSGTVGMFGRYNSTDIFTLAA